MNKHWNNRNKVKRLLADRWGLVPHRCSRCGTYEVERHERLFGTANREKSVEFSLFVWLCPEHHRGNTGAHHDRMFDLALRIEAQQEFESACMEVGYSPIESRELFLHEFGRNYLE